MSIKPSTETKRRMRKFLLLQTRHSSKTISTIFQWLSTKNISKFSAKFTNRKKPVLKKKNHLSLKCIKNSTNQVPSYDNGNKKSTNYKVSWLRPFKIFRNTLKLTKLMRLLFSPSLNLHKPKSSKSRRKKTSWSNQRMKWKLKSKLQKGYFKELKK